VPLTPDNLNVVWQQLITLVGFTVGNELRKAISLAISGPNALVIVFPSGYNLGDKFLDAARLARIEEALAKLTGQTWGVRVEFQQAPAGEAAAVAAVAAEPAGSRLRRQKDEISQHPLVAKAKEVLAAQIMAIDEGFGAVVPAEPKLIEVSPADAEVVEDV